MESKSKRSNYHESSQKVFPKRLSAVMEKKSVTQKELADRLGLSSRQSVGYYLQGTSSPDWEKLAKIASVLGVSADWLLGLSDNPSRDEDKQVVTETTGLSNDAISALSDVNGWTSHKREQYLLIINGLLGCNGFWTDLMKEAVGALTVKEGAIFNGAVAPTPDAVPDEIKAETDKAVDALRMANGMGYNEWYPVSQNTAIDIFIHNATRIFETMLKKVINGEIEEGK